ncbi:MAG: HAMP domain-containing protein [Anaerolineaceae bacterium]|nr:HAMP domain-containing protein [Anaerolineaceae bacterium]
MNKLWVRIALAYVLTLVVAFSIPILALSGLDAIDVIDLDSAFENMEARRLERGVDFETESRGWQNFPVELLTLIFVWGGLGSVAGILVSFRIARPVAELAHAAEKVGEKNFTLRVVEQGPDEIQNLARSFNQMAGSLQNAEQLRQNLLADVSHELRTPLTVLEGQLRGALDGVMALDNEELANLYGQTQYLIRLVKDLHELAQVESGQMRMEILPNDISFLLKEVTNVFQPLAVEKSVQLGLEIPDGLSEVGMDTMRMRQVFHNLLSNSLRYTPAGGKITITALESSDKITITIVDTGEGIDLKDIAYLFDRFYRTDSSRNRETGGSGLGLAITKAIVEAHKGKVQVDSGGKGSGATFTIILPK